MEALSYETFAPCVGSTFQVLVDGRAPLNLELAEVENQAIDDPNRNGRGRRDPFSLIFHGPLSPVAPQQLFELDHEQLGRLQIFLVPIGPGGQAGQKMQYQAVFN